MKKMYFISAIALLATLSSCSNNSGNVSQNADSLSVDSSLAVNDSLDWDAASLPMPIFVDNTYDDDCMKVLSQKFFHPIAGNDDSAACCSMPDTYHTLTVLGKKFAFSYQGFQDGPESGSLLSGDYSKYMKALKYHSVTKVPDTGDGFAFNDNFVAKHTIYKVDCITFDRTASPVSNTLKTKVEAIYNNKVKDSRLIAEIPEIKMEIYSVEMQPVNNVAIGMYLVALGDEMYIHEEKSEYSEDLGYWNGLDNFYSGYVCTVTKSDLGYDVFVISGTEETTSYDVMLLRNGKIIFQNIASYYNYESYEPPLEAVKLPAGSELKAELNGYKVWIHQDKAPENGKVCGTYSVYYSTPDSKDTYKLVTTNPNNYSDIYSDYVTPDSVATAQNAFIVKDPESDCYMVILEGAVDGNDLMDYSADLPYSGQQMFRCYNSNTGYKGLDETGKKLIFDFVGGGHHQRSWYSFDGELLDQDPDFEE